MGKSWKEKPGKYRNDRNFQKKQKQKHGQKHVPLPQEEEFGDVPVKDWEDWQNT
jgi:hypothetical protein